MRRLWKALAAGLLTILAVAIAYVAVQLHRRPARETYNAPLLPQAAPDAPFRVRFGGVATLVFDDGETQWMTDGFFSRPSLARVVFTRIEPDRAAIATGLAKLGVDKLAAVVPVHSHYDHAMDAPLVAKQTGAQLIGSESTLNVGRGLGLPEQRMRKVAPGDNIVLGRWRLTFIASRHVPLGVAASGSIDVPLVPPAPVHSTNRSSRFPISATTSPRRSRTYERGQSGTASSSECLRPSRPSRRDARAAGSAAARASKA